MYIARSLESKILSINSHFPAVLVTGARQVGKTTMFKAITDEERKYVSLDNLENRQFALTDPRGFIAQHQPPVLIDEIQYAPNILSYIKIHIDEHQVPGGFWLTGSQQFNTMQGVTESLAGRVAILPMYPLSQAEIRGEQAQPFVTRLNEIISSPSKRTNGKLPPLFSRILLGSMPASQKWADIGDSHDVSAFTSTFYESYIKTYLERDIALLAQVGDIMTFYQFLKVCAARTAQIVNYSEMAKEVGVTSPTIKKWVSILESSGVIVLVPPFFTNQIKRIVKAPKLIFMDTGLAAWLAGWPLAEPLERSAASGQFLENYVISEIIKSLPPSGLSLRLFHYRDVKQREIDVIVQEENILYPIEIKKRSSLHPSDTKHFDVLQATKQPIGTRTVIYTGDQAMPLAAKTWAIPVDWL